MPLPSSGGIILAQSLAILETLRYPQRPRGSAERDHLLAETWRRAYADRFVLGDPEHARAGEAQLLSDGWIPDPALSRPQPSRCAASDPIAKSAGSEITAL